MNKVVLDASALLALLTNEKGADVVAEALGDAIISTVSLAEVAGNLADHGMTDTAIQKALSIGFDEVPFTVDEAIAAAGIRRKTKSLGLSLGDRACLATAQFRGATVITADRQWAKAKIPRVTVKVIDRK